MTANQTHTCREGRPYRLENRIQHYAWGTQGDLAFIPHLLGITPEPGQVYAELWLGVHHLAPSILLDPRTGKIPLSDWLASAPDKRLGKTGRGDTPQTLPYLLKVLSIDQALSIQAHPNRAQARRLHAQDPDHYPDANHKPEIAIAIDYLDALIGFLTPEALAERLKTVPELISLLQLNMAQPPNLKKLIPRLLSIYQKDSQQINQCLLAIQARLSQKPLPDETESLFLEQINQHGTNDIGTLFLFFLNRIHLRPGEAVFLPPGIPHAYLKGNIIECMANSDNVVRLGLTPKFCDTTALLEILNFDAVTTFRVPTSSDGYVVEYETPVTEFRIKALDLLQGESRAFSYRSSLTMFLLLDGEISLQWGKDTRSVCNCIYRRGDSFITPANLTQFIIQAKSHAKLYLVEMP